MRSKLMLRRFGAMSYFGHAQWFDPLDGVGGKELAFWAEQHLRPGIKILEIGCGIGSLSCYLSRFGAQVTAVDIHTGAIRLARRNRDISGTKPRFVISDLFENVLFNTAEIIILHPPSERTLPENRPAIRGFYERFWEGVAFHSIGPCLVASSALLGPETLQIAALFGWNCKTESLPLWFSK